MIINLDLLKTADITEEMIASEEFKDETLSGNHLVTGIVHHSSSDGYFMNVTAKKDSFIKELKGIKGET
jgi:ABC-type phosphate/phosphonate transport system substrate-binding protein